MKHALNITTTLILCGSMAQAYAQSPAACIPTPSCTTLGYTSTTSCTGGLKCPFGNYWNCDAMTKITELTNKITELEGKIENNQLGQGECSIGAILYSDKTCSNIITAGKTPIGVVVYSDASWHGQAIALEDVEGEFFSFSRNYIGSLGSGFYACFVTKTAPADFPFKSTKTEAVTDFDSCGNTTRLASGNDTYPAVSEIEKYSTSGTIAGDWCMPAAGVLNYIYQNFQLINSTLKMLGAEEFTESLSSSMASDSYYWYLKSGLNTGTINSIALPTGGSDCIVYGPSITRPVLEF